MHLHQLTLRQFRNIREASLHFSARKQLILGANAQGKTNLLEAIQLLSCGRSHRASTDSELVWNPAISGHTEEKPTEGSLIEAELEHTGAFQQRSTLNVKLVPSGQNHSIRLRCQLDGANLRSRSQLLGKLPSVSFYLSDLLMVRGTPSDRRRWWDGATSQWRPIHLDRLQQFQRVHKQKSHFLKGLGLVRSPEHLSSQHQAMWAVLNQQFIEAGARLTESRLNYLRALRSLLQTQHQQLCGQASLAIHWQPGGWLEKPTYPEARWPESLEALNQSLSEQVEARQADELIRGQCLVGPHRDDIDWVLNERMSLRQYGSQGQQRTAVLALKLAELSLLSEQLAEPPLLLLDDVMAELDPQRQAQLISSIPDSVQLFLTTTHLDQEALQPVLKASDAQLWQVENGVIQPASGSPCIPAKIG